MKVRLSVVLIILNTAIAWGDIRIVTTGDSITNGYSNRLQTTMNAMGDRATVFKVASGGNHAERYTGHEVDPTTNTVRDYAQEVLAYDPDVIVFMLGTNDAFKYVNDPNWVNLYTSDLNEVFHTFKTARNNRGRHPIVIVATVLPILRDATINAAVDDVFNPWLIQSTTSKRFQLLDTNALIQLENNWEEFYNDGVHLWANDAEGFWWLAGVVRDSITNIKHQARKVRR